MQNIDIYELMKKINYEFKNKNLLYEALTHSSYVNEHSNIHIKDYERLEFLGDSVMDLITTELIYHKNKKSDEGKLSKYKSKIISEKVFSYIARDMNLGKYIFLSNGEINSGGEKRDAILCDVFEALVGAIFEDSDYYKTKEIILPYLENKINNLDKIEGILDYKTELQEITQLKFKTTPIYETVSENGPDHNKEFEVCVKIGNEIYGYGNAKSKKNAEKNAAKVAIERLTKGEK